MARPTKYGQGPIRHNLQRVQAVVDPDDYFAIYNKRISVYILPKAADHIGKKHWRHETKNPERPAGFGYFTIRQIGQIIQRVIDNPLETVHQFRFPSGRYLVKVYDPALESQDIDTQTIS